ncbi:SDR family NAD(P)-dependent oxidoreductase [[Clostridium] hylemonae]|uniref:Oxidoreductase, short chain dehydrogenase/reductase family protein n=1 Tax=[Clostridium] hylemonae DSM 15053 TaxID=553973 RepID=C0BXQ5_9FIRM|nr:SDR family oxidoreductase [[Clostridium] hylemonae]EEG75362.1 oxidoreductase, short chain dehydrogenase/reductase family protein [[Clostridium] hylemonae DSM 15053]QEK17074.1 Cyclopentanol dehydrogenase [[Clostridium] hylemonae DSM 15053]
MGRVDGKTAVITGGGSGFGQASVLTFAGEGANVVVVDISEANGTQVTEKVKASGGEAVFVKADVTSEKDWENVRDTALKTYGQIDILFNNAGICLMPENADIAHVDMSIFDRTMDINVRGVWLGVRTMAEELVKSKGYIVNTASVAAFKGPLGAAAYATSKGAVVAMTYAIANELGLWGVRCNCISPYAADTPIGANVPVEMVRKARTGNPLYTTIDPYDVAKTALFLTSGECRCINGSNYFVDAGAVTMTQPCSIKDFVDANAKYYEGAECTHTFE